MGNVIKCADFDKLNSGEITLDDIRKKQRQESPVSNPSALRRHLERKLQAKAIAVQRAAAAVDPADSSSTLAPQNQASVSPKSQVLRKTIVTLQNNKVQSDSVVVRSVEDIKAKIGSLTDLLEDVRRVQTLYTPVEYPTTEIKEVVSTLSKQQLSVKDTVSRVQLDIGQIQADMSKLVALFNEYEEAFAEHAEAAKIIDFSVVVDAVRKSADNLSNLLRSQKSDESIRINERFTCLEKVIVDSVKNVIQQQVEVLQNEITTMLTTTAPAVGNERLVLEHVQQAAALQAKTEEVVQEKEAIQGQLLVTQAVLQQREAKLEELQQLLNSRSTTELQYNEHLEKLQAENQQLQERIAQTQSALAELELDKARLAALEMEKLQLTNEKVQTEQQQVRALAVASTEKQALAEQLSQTQAALTELRSALARVEAEQVQAEQQHVRALAVFSTEKQELVDKYNEAQKRLAALRSETEFVKAERLEIEQQYAQELATVSTEKQELAAQLAQAQKTIAALESAVNEKTQSEQRYAREIATLLAEKKDLVVQTDQAQKAIVEIEALRNNLVQENERLTQSLTMTTAEKQELLVKLDQEQTAVAELDDLVAQRSQALIQLEKQKQLLQTQMISVSKEKEQLSRTFETFKLEAQEQLTVSVQKEQDLAREQLAVLQKELDAARVQTKLMDDTIAGLTQEKQTALTQAQEYGELYAQENARAEKIRQYALKVSEYVKQLKEYIKVIQDENNQYRLKLTIFEKRSEAKAQPEPINTLDEDFIPVVRSRAMGAFPREKVA